MPIDGLVIRAKERIGRRVDSWETRSNASIARRRVNGKDARMQTIRDREPTAGELDPSGLVVRVGTGRGVEVTKSPTDIRSEVMESDGCDSGEAAGFGVGASEGNRAGIEGARVGAGRFGVLKTTEGEARRDRRHSSRTGKRPAMSSCVDYCGWVVQ